VRNVIAFLLSCGVVVVSGCSPPDIVFPPLEPEAWGDAVQGVQLRLAVAPLPPPHSGVLPPLEMRLRNKGSEHIVFRPNEIGLQAAEIEIDGVSWTPRAYASINERWQEFPPGDLIAIIPFEVTFGGRQPSAPVELRPGRHSVRVRIPRGVAIANRDTPYPLPKLGESIALVSNLIEIDVARGR
jgi:hypothetical protein